MSEHQRQEKSSSKSGHPWGNEHLCCFCLLSLSPLLQVLYRWNRQSSTSVIETNKTSVELSLPFDEDYIIEIKPFSDGGDGSSSEQIRIPKISSKDGKNQGRCPFLLPPSYGELASPDPLLLRTDPHHPSHHLCHQMGTTQSREAEQSQAVGLAISWAGS